jgi:phospholipid/cholesterol/gamma-HCH transport system ATP-binding protein
VVGGSGTGKSVLMRAILGLRPPQAGRIEVLGVDALSGERERRLHVSATPACCSRTARCSPR